MEVRLPRDSEIHKLGTAEVISPSLRPNQKDYTGPLNLRRPLASYTVTYSPALGIVYINYQYA